MRVPQTSFGLCGSSNQYSFEIILYVSAHTESDILRENILPMSIFDPLHTRLRKKLMFRIHKGIVGYIWTFLTDIFFCLFIYWQVFGGVIYYFEVNVNEFGCQLRPNTCQIVVLSYREVNMMLQGNWLKLLDNTWRSCKISGECGMFIHLTTKPPKLPQYDSL